DEVRIVDDAGRDVADGASGELWCRGPYTLRGYYRAPERNREVFSADGFYKTGDVVRRDKSGNLVVEGRVKDLINRGGEKIRAEDIESHLLAHPAIARAAVVAMPDAILGEKGCAYVTLRSGTMLRLEDLKGFLASRGVAKFKWPERMEVIDEMPLTNVGKVRKVELRADIARKLAAERGGS
ncbi:MAG: AMP-binding enzyme, partial [Candidatus Binataceae bacterium]